jgi:Protein of unknown function (DUF732)
VDVSVSASVAAELAAEEKTFVTVIRGTLPKVSAKYPNDADLARVGLSVCDAFASGLNGDGVASKLTADNSLTSQDATALMAAAAGSVCLH